MKKRQREPYNRLCEQKVEKALIQLHDALYDAKKQIGVTNKEMSDRIDGGLSESTIGLYMKKVPKSYDTLMSKIYLIADSLGLDVIIKFKGRT